MLFLKRIHFIILTPDLIWNTALPRLDFIEMFLDLIISALANIDRAPPLVYAFRSTAGIPSEEHDEAF